MRSVPKARPMCHGERCLLGGSGRPLTRDNRYTSTECPKCGSRMLNDHGNGNAVCSRVSCGAMMPNVRLTSDQHPFEVAFGWLSDNNGTRSGTRHMQELIKQMGGAHKINAVELEKLVELTFRALVSRAMSPLTPVPFRVVREILKEQNNRKWAGCAVARQKLIEPPDTCKPCGSV